MRIQLLIILLFSLTACNGGGGGGGGSSAANTIDNISSDIERDDQDLEDVARVLEDQVDFEYKVEELAPLDYTSQSKLGPAYTDDTGKVYKTIYQQFRLASNDYGPMKIFEFSADGSLSQIATINEDKRVIRFFKLQDQYIYETINPNEFKVYNPSSDTITSLQEIHTLENPKRRIKRVKRSANTFCGTLNENNKLFHLNTNSSSSPLSSSFETLDNQYGDIKRWECNQYSLVAYTKSGQVIFWDISNKLNSVTTPNAISCSAERFTILKRDQNIYYRCSNLNEKNKWVHQYKVAGISSAVLVDTLPPAPAKQEHQFYRFKLDHHSANDENKKTIVYTRYKKEDWQTVELNLDTTPIAINKVQASVNEKDFYIATGKGLTKLNIKSKVKDYTTLPYPWLKVWSDSQDHVLFKNAEVFSFDQLFQENHFKNFVIDRNKFLDYKRWSPLDKIELAGRYQIIGDNIYYLDKSGKLHIINHQKQTQYVVKTLNIIGKFNWKIQGSTLYLFTNGDSSNGHFKTLIKYDIELDKTETIPLAIATKRKYQFKLKDDYYLLYSGADLRGYNLSDNSLRFEYAFRHRGAPYFLPSGKVLVLLNFKVQLLNPKDGSLQELYEFKDENIFNKVRSYYFADTTMLLRDGSDKLKTLRIPYGKVHLFDEPQI